MTGWDVTLLRPLWLAALPLLAVAGWWLHRRRSGLGDWHRAADAELLRALAALGRVDVGSSRAALNAMLAVLAIVVVALSGPALERRDTLSFRNLDGVLLVVDVSSSVTEAARWPQMLTMARFAIASLGTRPGGLIVYGGDAYMATDMTLDHLQLGQTLSLVDADLVPDGGSRPARALALAAERLESAEVIAGDVVLFTDGDGLGQAALREAGRIAAQGARLSLVALEDAPPAFATHASVGQGHVFTLDEAVRLGQWLESEARTRLAAQDYPLLFWVDLGRYVLFLALLPLLFLFRRAPS